MFPTLKSKTPHAKSQNSYKILYLKSVVMFSLSLYDKISNTCQMLAPSGNWKGRGHFTSQIGILEWVHAYIPFDFLVVNLELSLCIALGKKYFINIPFFFAFGTSCAARLLPPCWIFSLLSSFVSGNTWHTGYCASSYLVIYLFMSWSAMCFWKQGRCVTEDYLSVVLIKCHRMHYYLGKNYIYVIYMM